MENKLESSSSITTTLERHMPALLMLAAAWIGLRGLKKLAWTAFALVCAWRWVA